MHRQGMLYRHVVCRSLVLESLDVNIARMADELLGPVFGCGEVYAAEIKEHMGLSHGRASFPQNLSMFLIASFRFLPTDE
jgi:hypothetical protein